MLTNCHFPAKETEIMVAGPAGNLQTVIVGPEHSTEMNAIAIICHPHPLYGGTMQNKVVTTLVNTFKDLGLAVVRFNFRGVGKSEGQHDHAKGEIADLYAILHWVKQQCPTQKIWLAGFSFGSFIAASVATKENIEKLILVAPAVNHYDYTRLPEFSCPTYVVQGDQDEIVPAQEVYDWINHRKNPPQLIRFPTATHFFHGHLGKMREMLMEKLTH